MIITNYIKYLESIDDKIEIEAELERRKKRQYLTKFDSEYRNGFFLL